MKPKEYLVSIGELEKVGKGRLSLKHIDMCKAAVAKGIHIEGYSKTFDTPVSSKATVSVKKVDSDSIPADREPTRAEEDWEARAGKENVGMRTVCENCHNSLTYCFCRFPVITWTGEPTVVTFIRRTTPLPKKPW